MDISRFSPVIPRFFEFKFIVFWTFSDFKKLVFHEILSENFFLKIEKFEKKFFLSCIETSGFFITKKIGLQEILSEKIF